MTAKELFKKVENYNKLGEELNREKIEVVFNMATIALNYSFFNPLLPEERQSFLHHLYTIQIFYLLMLLHG